jgi:hypothetical protein
MSESFNSPAGMPAISSAQLFVKGKPTAVPSITTDGRTIVCESGWLRTAKIFDEDWLDVAPLTSPASLVERVRESGLAPDLFTFAQTLPDTTPRYSYHLDFDNLAIANTTDFKAWWEGLPQESRKNVRQSQKRGVTTMPVEFTDELVRGIKAIYDESPVRQGRRFWHYGKDLATVKRENSSYLERSQFIGSYLDGELIGFLKMVYSGGADGTARIMQILARNDQYNKHPTNALLASAVELCAKKPIARLIYGQYVYGKKRGSSVTEFKRRNGFHEVLLPRYYVPFTLKGRMALAIGTHRGLAELLPEPLINVALEARTFTYRKFLAPAATRRSRSSS